MKPIASFNVDHNKLLPGVYVSRVDQDEATGATVTTFDIRVTAPNREPVMDIAAVHAFEHIGATVLRNHPEWAAKVLYFGPMGCRTGFYLLLFGTYTSHDVLPLIQYLMDEVAQWEGEVPGALPEACGNYHDSDPAMAAYYARKFQDVVLKDPEGHLVYQGLLDAKETA